MRSTARLTGLLFVIAIAGVATIQHAMAAADPRVSPDQAKPAPATSEACTLLTNEIATAALGEAIKGPSSTDVPARGSGPGSGAASSCEYTGSGLHAVMLTVMHLDAGSAAIYKQLCAQKTKDGLTGLGDVACWYNAKHEELQMLKGTRFLSIELRRAGNPTEAIKSAAKKIYDSVK